MFVSYSTKDQTYGYMCFSSIEVDKLYKRIQDALFDKSAKLLFLCDYSNAEKHYVYTHTTGTYRTILYEDSLKDVEEVGDLYLYLYKKYGFTNILGFIPV